MANFHGIEISSEATGTRPFTVPGQSVLGTVIPATPEMDGAFGNDAGTAVEYNKPFYLTSVPSTDDLDDITANQHALQVLDQIYRQGRIPMQVVFVPVGAAQTARAEQTMTEPVLAAATVDTKAELDALSAYSFQLLTIGDFKYLAFGGDAGVPAADTAKFNMINPGDTIQIKASGGAGNALEEYTAERAWSTNNNWIRVNDTADTSALTAGTDYEPSAPATLARTADENTYDNILGRQAAQTGIYALRAGNPRVKIFFCGHPVASEVTGGAANGLASSIEDLAQELGGVAILDGPGTDLDDILIAETLYGGKHIIMADPHIYQAFDEDNTVPPSPTLAAAMAVNDYTNGYWSSPSNMPLAGVLNTSRDISHGFEGSEADVLNDQGVTTIIKDGGFLWWGNESLNPTDTAFQFVQIYRTEQAIIEALRISLRSFIDRNITLRFFEGVAQSCNAFLADLTSKGAITGGECYPDGDVNTAANIKSGVAGFVVRWSGVYPAQTIRIKLELTEDFLEANLTDLIGNL